MSLSMYQAAVPPVLRILSNLTTILDKVAEHCTARKIDPAVLLNARLYPDMYPVLRQVQIVTDMAKGGLGRLAGVEVPSYADTETTIDELKARLAKTAEFAKSLPADSIDGTEAKEIILKFGPNEMAFAGQAYLIGFVLPNLYFHATTAYAILRHNGVEIGKRDFLGAP